MAGSSLPAAAVLAGDVTVTRLPRQQAADILYQVAKQVYDQRLENTYTDEHSIALRLALLGYEQSIASM